MDRRTIGLVVALFVLIVIGMFTFAYLKRAEVAPSSEPVSTTPKVEPPSALFTRIDAKHFYVDGKHTFVGELPMPTPCDLLEVSEVVTESFPAQVRLDFKVINNSTTCAQMITSQRFMVTAQAPQDARITATFAGQPIPINLIPAGPGETPEDFELFIKG